MPHDKARGAGGVVLDRRRALTITAVGKLDSCRVGNPFKIPKRRVSGEEECADVDVAKCARKCPKIHWSQLASNGGSSQATRCHNGSQKANHGHKDVESMDIDRRQVKVILTDVLQTKEGRRYLNSCSRDSETTCQTDTLKKETRWGWSDKRMSADHRNNRRSSQAHRKPINSASSKDTDSASTEENDIQLSNKTTSPTPKRIKRNSNSLKQTEPSTSDENESRSQDETVSPQSKQMNISEAKQTKSPGTDNNQLCPLVESDSQRSTSASSLHPKESNVADDQHANSQKITDCNVTETPKQTTLLSLTRRRLTQEYSGNATDSTQHNSSVREMEKTAEDVRENKVVNDEEKEMVAVQRNGEVIEEGGGSRGSVLRLSIGAVGDQLQMGLADGEHRAQPESSGVEVRKVSKPHTPEPIVLSSEEEEEEENSSKLKVKTLEGAKVLSTPQRRTPAAGRKKTVEPFTFAPEMHNQTSSFANAVLSSTPIMELHFSGLYIGGISALCKGVVKITHDMITISLKDPTDKEVKASLPTVHLHKYSVWDGLVVWESRLVKQNKTPPLSLLLLWLSEVQAKRLYSDLSVIQPGTHQAEGSVCLVLCLCEALKGVEGAILASIMDIVGIKHGTTGLLSPLTHSESMKLLQTGQDTHLLQLLSPPTDTQTKTEESRTTPLSAGTATSTVTSQEPDVQANSVYTLCHSRAKDSYSVFMVPKPGPEWNPYRHRGPARRLIQFPPPPCKGAITVTTEDLECLESGEFLNDVIIDFYLKYLLVQKAPQASVKRSHVFSSFFYKQLTRRDNANEDSTSTPAQLRRHQRVRTWTRHVDIFEKDFLFVPVNQEAHWYLVVVCFPGMDEPQLVEREERGSVQDGTENSSESLAGSESQECSRLNSDGDKSSDENSSKPTTPGPPNCTEKTCKRRTVCKRPCILIMDSLKLSVHERIFKLLREYLQVEWEVKRGGQRDFSAERMVGSHCKVPLQDNSSDCGLYLLQYAESFLQDPVVHFDLPLRLECWFPRQQVREKREEIRDLVLHLYRFQQSALGHEGSDDKNETGNVVQ